MRDVNHIPKFAALLHKQLEVGTEQLGRKTLAQIDHGFEAGTDAMGRPWEPLAPSTIAAKGHDQILIDTTEMRGSYEMAVDANPIRGHYRLEISNPTEYAAYHEFGVPDRGLPKRPTLVPAGEWAVKEATEGVLGDALDAAIASSIVF